MADGEDSSLLTGTLSDARSAMHKGRAGSLVTVIALGVAALAGLAFLVSGDDQARVYGEIGKKVNGLERAHFSQFWGCALPGENVAELRSNVVLVTQLEGRASERGRRYGVYVREKCLPKLQDIGPALDTLIVPDDLLPDMASMKEANAQLRSAFSTFIAYLDDPELDYDPEKAEPQLKQIARAFYEFKKAHAALNAKIKGKLQ